MNMLDSLGHREGLLPCMTNLDVVAPSLLAHLREQASSDPALSGRVQAIIDLLTTRLGARALQDPGQRLRAEPALTTGYRTPHGELTFFSLFTTFGTPQDITRATLRADHLCRVDEFTRNLLRERTLLSPAG